MPLATWMDLESIRLTELSRRKAMGFPPYVESKKQMNKRNRLINTENKWVVARGRRVEGRVK